MKGFIEEYGKIVVVGIILMIFVVFAPRLGTNLLEHISNVHNKITESTQENRLVNGSSFNYYLSQNIEDSDKLHFVKGRKSSTDVEPFDYSASKDKSILGWREGNTYYISSNGKILAPENSSYMFNNLNKLTEIKFDNFYTYECTNMKSMFQYTGKLTSIDLTNFQTHNVTNFASMFAESGLTSVDFNHFDTRKATNMSFMFYRMPHVTSITFGPYFDTSNVKDMGYMFRLNTNLTSLNIAGFNTKNVTTMQYMFSYCNNLSALDVSGFDTRNVTNMIGTFEQLKVDKLDVEHFDTQNVTNMDYMFAGCSNAKLDLSKWDVQNVTTYNNFNGNAKNIIPPVWVH